MPGMVQAIPGICAFMENYSSMSPPLVLSTSILLLMSWSQPEMLCAKLQQRDALLEEYGNEAN